MKWESSCFSAQATSSKKLGDPSLTLTVLWERNAMSKPSNTIFDKKYGFRAISSALTVKFVSIAWQHQSWLVTDSSHTWQKKKELHWPLLWRDHDPEGSRHYLGCAGCTGCTGFLWRSGLFSTALCTWGGKLLTDICVQGWVSAAEPEAILCILEHHLLAPFPLISPIPTEHLGTRLSTCQFDFCETPH